MSGLICFIFALGCAATAGFGWTMTREMEPEGGIDSHFMDFLYLMMSPACFIATLFSVGPADFTPEVIRWTIMFFLMVSVPIALATAHITSGGLFEKQKGTS